MRIGELANQRHLSIFGFVYKEERYDLLTAVELRESAINKSFSKLSNCEVRETLIKYRSVVQYKSSV